MSFESQPITIEHWHAWAPGLNSRQDCLHWAKQPTLLRSEEKIQPQTIPANVKRRCNHLAKMTIETSNQAIKNGGNFDYAVFSSQHGDLPCVLALFKDLVKQEALSPMQFVQSVHNAAAGSFSIQNKITHNISAIAAGNRTFFMAMIEACTWLKLNPKHRVLVTMSDDKIPEVYSSIIANNHHPSYALSLILTNAKHSGIKLRLTESQLTPEVKTKLPFGLEFLAWLIQDAEPELSQIADKQQYTWLRVHKT